MSDAELEKEHNNIFWSDLDTSELQYNSRDKGDSSEKQHKNIWLETIHIEVQRFLVRNLLEEVSEIVQRKQ